MNFIIRTEKYAFNLLILGLIFSILSGTGILTPILKWIIFSVNIILSWFYFPLLVYAKNNTTIDKAKKGAWFILSNYLLMLTCSAIAIVQLVQIEPIILLIKIIALSNGLCYITYLILGKNYNILFTRHFVVSILLGIFIYIVF